MSSSQMREGITATPDASGAAPGASSPRGLRSTVVQAPLASSRSLMCLGGKESASIAFYSRNQPSMYQRGAWSAW